MSRPGSACGPLPKAIPDAFEGEYRYNRLGRGWASRVPFSCEAERTGRSYFCTDDTYGVSFARISFPGGILSRSGDR